MSADEVMSRVSFGRLQIESAEFIINVVKKQTVTAAESGELFAESSENWEGHCYFDSSRSSSLMRFTRTGDLTKTIAPSPLDRKYVSRKSLNGFAFLDVEKQKGAAAIFIYKDNESANSINTHFAPPNPQCIGIATLTDLTKGLGIADVLSRYVTLKNAETPQVLQDKEKGLVTVTIIYNQGTHRREVVFDTNNAWVPLRDTYEKGKYVAETNAFIVDHLVFESVSTWKSMSGIVAPVEVVQHQYRPEYSRRPETSKDTVDIKDTITTINLKWLSLNERMEAKTFSLDAFDLPSGSIVADKRGPETVIERVEALDAVTVFD